MGFRGRCENTDCIKDIKKWNCQTLNLARLPIPPFPPVVQKQLYQVFRGFARKTFWKKLGCTTECTTVRKLNRFLAYSSS
jgi:hypothetical protein